MHNVANGLVDEDRSVDGVRKLFALALGANGLVDEDRSVDGVRKLFALALGVTEVVTVAVPKLFVPKFEATLVVMGAVFILPNTASSTMLTPLLLPVASKHGHHLSYEMVPLAVVMLVRSPSQPE